VLWSPAAGQNDAREAEEIERFPQAFDAIVVEEIEPERPGHRSEDGKP
jgi:hypothetical protein